MSIRPIHENKCLIGGKITEMVESPELERQLARTIRSDECVITVKRPSESSIQWSGMYE